MSVAVADLRRLAPGLALAVAVAAGATLAGAWLPPAFGPVLLAVLLGVVLGNAVALPAATGPGLAFAAKHLLRGGVVLLGARLSLGSVAGIGVRSIALVAGCMGVAFGCVALLARAVRLAPRLTMLIAVGCAVCGNSAIMATAPVIDADEREVSFALACITVLGTLSLLVFPLVGRATGMADHDFGLWTGLAVNDTSQVVATSAAYSDLALEVATVVKLVRNALMAPVILAILWWSRRQGRDHGGAAAATRQAVPLFAFGFLALAALRSLGVIPATVAADLGGVATLLITVAIAAVSLGTRWASLRSGGPAGLLVGAGATALLALFALGVIHVFV